MRACWTHLLESGIARDIARGSNESNDGYMQERDLSVKLKTIRELHLNLLRFVSILPSSGRIRSEQQQIKILC